MVLDGVYVDMAQGLVLGLKPKPEFLPLFNLGEPVTTGDAELVTGGWSRVELHRERGMAVLVMLCHPSFLRDQSVLLSTAAATL